MADFDWDKDSAPAQGANFDWERETTPADAAPRMGSGSSAGGAFIRGVAQGATADFADELGAGLQAGLQGLANALPEGSLEWAGIENKYQQNPLDTYRQAREENRAQIAQDMEQHTGAALAGNIGGGLLLNSVVPGAKLTGTPGLLRAAGMGAAAGLGASDADLTRGEVGGAAADTLKGAAMGLAGQEIGERIGGYLPKVAQWVQRKAGDFAAMRALNAAGYFQNELKPILKRGGIDKAVEMGEHLLDEPGVIRAGRDAESVLEGVEAARSKWGGEVGAILDEADATGVRFDVVPFARRVMDEVVKPKMADPIARPNVRRVAEIVADYVEAARQQGGTLSFRQANEFKTTLQQEGINWGNHWNNYGPTHHQQKYEMALQGIFTDEIDTQLGGVLGDEAYAAFKNAKNHLGSFIDAEAKASNLNAKLQGNSFFSLSDLSKGAVAGGGIPGVLAVIGSKLGRERGASVLARGAYAFSNSSGLEAIARANPEALGKYAGMVTAALSRGPGALAALDKVLRDTDPEWRQLREQQAESQQQAR